MTKIEEIRYLVTYQKELRSVGNDLSKLAKARLRKLQREVEYE